MNSPPSTKHIQNGSNTSVVYSWRDIPWFRNVVRLRAGLQDNCDIVLFLGAPETTRKYLANFACKLVGLKHKRASVVLLDGCRPLLRHLRPLWVGNPKTSSLVCLTKRQVTVVDPYSLASKKLVCRSLISALQRLHEEEILSSAETSVRTESVIQQLSAVKKAVEQLVSLMTNNSNSKINLKSELSKSI